MSADRIVSFHLSRRVLLVLALLLLLPWGVVAILATRGAGLGKPDPGVTPGTAKVPAQADGPATPGTAAATRSNARWGTLQTARILLEPPEEFILAEYTNPVARPWVFQNYDRARLHALWQRAGLTPDVVAALDAVTTEDPARTTLVVRPPDAVVLDLTPEARSVVYAALAEFSDNVMHQNPYRLRTSLADSWLENAELPDPVVALTRRLLYPRGVATCLSDDHLVLAATPDPATRVRLVKALARKSGLVVTLRVAPQDDIEQLVAYWGRGGRSKDLRPLLNSLARRPGGGEIDVVHLIPRFARRLVYTYPLPSYNPADAAHDCHWTSFNFFNDEPDERFADIQEVGRELDSRYYPVPGEARFGDLILFVKPGGVVVHSCVYIADDIVFTKNGPAFSVPWMLTSLEDVRVFYGSEDTQERRYRAKER